MRGPDEPDRHGRSRAAQSRANCWWPRTTSRRSRCTCCGSRRRTSIAWPRATSWASTSRATWATATCRCPPTSAWERRFSNPNQRPLPPSTGYPVTVDADGTIDLPGAGTLAVAGKSIPEARAAIRTFYIQKKLLKAEIERVLVTLMQPRYASVLVLRQEATGFTLNLDLPEPSTKRGLGFQIDLPGYENDVLHALARSGGLPGLDVYNEVIILRDCFHTQPERAALLASVGKVPRDQNPLPMLPGRGVVRIPLRTSPGCVPACSAGRHRPSYRRRALSGSARRALLLHRRAASARPARHAARPRNRRAGGGGPGARPAAQRGVRRQQPVGRPGPAGHRQPLAEPFDGGAADAGRRAGAHRRRSERRAVRPGRTHPRTLRRHVGVAGGPGRRVRPLVHADVPQLRPVLAGDSQQVRHGRVDVSARIGSPAPGWVRSMSSRSERPAGRGEGAERAAAPPRTPVHDPGRNDFHSSRHSEHFSTPARCSRWSSRCWCRSSPWSIHRGSGRGRWHSPRPQAAQVPRASLSQNQHFISWFSSRFKSSIPAAQVR